MNRPLEGLKVVDFSLAASGPVCSRMMADWGADVVKVEGLEGEMMRKRPYEAFEWINLNKRALAVNAKDPEGLELIYNMIRESDFFVTNYRPKALKKLGLDYETVSKINPGIVYGAVTGYGESGPMAADPGYDITAFWARSGLLLELTEKDTYPLISPLGIGDYALGAILAGAMSAAYSKKLQTGKGDYVSTSLYSVGLYMNQWYLMRPQADPAFQYPVSRKEVMEPMSNCFQTKDKKWFQMTVFDFEKFFPKLLKIAKKEELFGTPGYSSFQDICDNHLAVTAMLDEAFAQYDWEELEKILIEGDFAFAKINLPQDTLTDEQAWANNYLAKYTCRTNGKEIIMPTTPIHFGNDELPPLNQAPLLGEHTAQVMEELGYSKEKIEDFIARKVVGQI